MSSDSSPAEEPRTENVGPDESTRPAKDSASAGNDVKDKFRQALERKRGQHADRDAAGDGLGSAKISAEHAAAKTQRTFRRKSGG